jgi:hypothetical protein
MGDSRSCVSGTVCIRYESLLVGIRRVAKGRARQRGRRGGRSPVPIIRGLEVEESHVGATTTPNPATGIQVPGNPSPTCHATVLIDTPCRLGMVDIGAQHAALGNWEPKCRLPTREICFVAYASSWYSPITLGSSLCYRALGPTPGGPGTGALLAAPVDAFA